MHCSTRLRNHKPEPKTTTARTRSCKQRQKEPGPAGRPHQTDCFSIFESPQRGELAFATLPVHPNGSAKMRATPRINEQSTLRLPIRGSLWSPAAAKRLVGLLARENIPSLTRPPSACCAPKNLLSMSSICTRGRQLSLKRGNCASELAIARVSKTPRLSRGRIFSLNS